MEEVKENSVSNELATPQTESHEQPSVEAEQPNLADKKRHDAAFADMRRKQRDLERDLQMQREMNEKLMQMATHANPVKQEVDELDAIGDEEFIPKGKVNKLVEKKAARIAEEIAKRETEKFFAEQKQSQFMDRLKSKYSDFEEVVNPETMALLEEQDPELATTIAAAKDPYVIGMQCYKYMKAMNLGDKVPSSRRAKEVEKKLEQNAKTVQTPQAFDKRPMAQAFQMSKAELSSIYKEMMGYAAGSY
jgi:predicted metal-dependent peptidase